MGPHGPDGVLQETHMADIAIHRTRRTTRRSGNSRAGVDIRARGVDSHASSDVVLQFQSTATSVRAEGDFIGRR